MPASSIFSNYHIHDFSSSYLGERGLRGRKLSLCLSFVLSLMFCQIVTSLERKPIFWGSDLRSWWQRDGQSLGNFLNETTSSAARNGLKQDDYGIPKWLSGKETTCQGRRHKKCGVQSPGREETLKEELATHSSILAKKIPQTEKPDGLQSLVYQELDTTEHTHACIHTHKHTHTHTHTHTPTE